MASPKFRSIIVIPTRTRPQRLTKTLESVINKSGSSDILVAIDEDEKDLYPRVENILYDVGPAPDPNKIGVNAKLNRLANQLKDDYDYLLFVADDVIIQSNKWDNTLIKAISDIKYGISHPSESNHDSRLLPSNGTCFDLRIVRTLGYLAPPAIQHLYIDNFWKRLATDLGTLKYVPKVKIDHNHFTRDNSLIDPLYLQTNARVRYEQDSQAFQIYIDHHLKADLAKIQKAVLDDTNP